MFKKAFILAAAVSISCLPLSAQQYSYSDDYSDYEDDGSYYSEEPSGNNITFSEDTITKMPGWEPEYTDKEKKINWLTGFSSAIVPSVVLGVWNRFICKQSWAQVYWDDIKDPSARTVKFDDDWYWTNFVLHPYQGGLYYMGARNSNFGVLGSTAIAFLGSTIWEYFWETNEPSINDMTYTPIGGFVLGEMLYRLSIDGSDLWKPLGYILNPMRLYTDHTTGHNPLGPHNNINKLSLRSYLDFSWGITDPYGGKNLDELYPGLLGVEVYTEYRDPYGHDSNDPFSQFELTFGGGVGAPSGEYYKSAEKKIGYDIHIFTNGMLWSRSIPEEIKTSTTMGFSLNYDFVWKNFYNYTSIAPGVGIKQRITFDRSHMDWQAHLGWILMGTTDNFYIRRRAVKATRPYSYTMGAEFVGIWRYFWSSGDLIDFSLRSYLMYDLPDYHFDGEARGWELLNNLTVRYEVPLTQNVMIGLNNELYYKHSWYRNYPDMNAFDYTAGMYARIKLKD